MSVLKGSLPFMADLMRAIDIPVRIDLMEVSSYGGTATESSGLVRILKDLSASIDGEDVLIVEDIIDTGLTLNYLIRYLRGKNPASLRICTLLDKPARRLVEIPVDYTGFTIPDQFVVGYGLDYGELYRNLRFVGVLKPEVYSGGRRRMTHASPAARPRPDAWRPSAACSSSSAASCRGGRSAARRASRPICGNGFEGTGILVFLVGIATLALVALPYAAGDRPLGLDRWLSFAILAVAGWIGFGWRVVELALDGAFQFSAPAEVFTNGPGLWVAGDRPGRAVAGDLDDDPRAGLPLRPGGPRL